MFNQHCPKLAKCWSTSSNMWTIIGQHWSASAKSRPNVVKLDQTLSEIGHCGVESGPTLGSRSNCLTTSGPATMANTHSCNHKVCLKRRNNKCAPFFLQCSCVGLAAAYFRMQLPSSRLGFAQEATRSDVPFWPGSDLRNPATSRGDQPRSGRIKTSPKWSSQARIAEPEFDRAEPHEGRGTDPNICRTWGNLRQSRAKLAGVRPKLGRCRPMLGRNPSNSEFRPRIDQACPISVRC